jgi:hypothetical protein
VTAHQIHSGRTGSRRSLRRSSRDRPPAVMWLEPPPDEPAREGRRSYGVVWCPTLSMLLSRRFDFVGMWRSGMWVACSAKSASEGRWASRGPGHPGATCSRLRPLRTYAVQIMYNESASLSRQSEPCKSSNSPIYVRYGGDSAPRTTRAREAEFPRPSTRKYPDRCAASVVRYGSAVTVSAAWWSWWCVVGPVFDGRVGNACAVSRQSA